MVTIAKKVRERVAPAQGKAAPVAHGVGRRKTAVARVWCSPGTGDIKVNGREVDVYFHTLPARAAAVFPLTVVPHVAKHYDISINLQSGGPNGQADAMKLGISRALYTLHNDEAVRIAFKKYKLLTVDSRVKERKKPGQKAARAKYRFVKR